MPFQGKLISADEFNQMVDRYDRYWSDKATTSLFSDTDKTAHKYGWGQSAVEPVVTISTIIESEHYNKLVAQLNSGLYHIHGDYLNSPMLDKVAAGIPILGELADGIAASTDYIDSNKFSVAPVNTFYDDSVVNILSNGSLWQGEMYSIASVTFESYNDARYFFNSGGLITVNLTANGGTYGTSYWSSLFDTIKEIRISAENIYTQDINTGVSIGGFYDMSRDGSYRSLWYAASSSGGSYGSYGSYGSSGYSQRTVTISLSGQYINNKFVVFVKISLFDSLSNTDMYLDGNYNAAIGYVAPAETPSTVLSQSSVGDKFKTETSIYEFAGYVDPLSVSSPNADSKPLPTFNIEQFWT